MNICHNQAARNHDQNLSLSPLCKVVFFIFLTILLLSTGWQTACASQWESVISNDSINNQSVPPSPTTDGTWSPVISPRNDPISDFWAHLARSQTKPTLKIGPADSNKNIAYILAGDLSSTKAWLVDVFFSLLSQLGLTSPPENATAIEWISGIVDQARGVLQAAGYRASDIRTDLQATSSELKGILENPQVGAIIWIGHGQVGKIIDTTASPENGIINESVVRRWALDFLEKKKVFKMPNFYPQNSRLFKTMSRIETRAHFGLNYFYSHTCLTMQDPSLALAMTAGGGRYEGYLESKMAYVTVLTPAVSRAVNHEIPDVHALVIVPEVTSYEKLNAKQTLEDQGFSCKIIEDTPSPDQYMAGQVYSQMPYEGTILDRNRADMHVTIYAYKQFQEDSSGNPNPDNSLGNTNEDENKLMIWINKFGDKGRVHVGTVKKFKAPKRYRDEWLAGISTDFLEKKDISDGVRFESSQEAKAKACEMVRDKKIINIPGWGRVPAGKYEGMRVWIDKLGCTIPPQD